MSNEARKLWVKAGANGPVFLPSPLQGAKTIGDEPVEIDDSLFVRRRLRVGDLIEVPAPGAEEKEL